MCWGWFFLIIFLYKKNPRFRPKFAQKHFLAKNGQKFGRRYYEKEEMVLLVVVVYPAAPAVGGGCTPPCWHRPCLLPLLWLRAFNCRSRLGWGVPPFLVAFASGFGAHHICYGSELLTVAPDSG